MFFEDRIDNIEDLLKVLGFKLIKNLGLWLIVGKLKLKIFSNEFFHLKLKSFWFFDLLFEYCGKGWVLFEAFQVPW